MNKHVADLAAPKVTTGPLPASRKIYATPDGAPDLRVPLREIGLSEGSGEAPLPVYDTSGPYSDPAVRIEALRVLRFFSAGVALPAARRAQDDSDPQVRAEAGDAATNVDGMRRLQMGR